MPYFSISPLSVTTKYVASPLRPCTSEWSPAETTSLSQTPNHESNKCLRQARGTCSGAHYPWAHICCCTAPKTAGNADAVFKVPLAAHMFRPWDWRAGALSLPVLWVVSHWLALTSLPAASLAACAPPAPATLHARVTCSIVRLHPPAARLSNRADPACMRDMVNRASASSNSTAVQ